MNVYKKNKNTLKKSNIRHQDTKIRTRTYNTAHGRL